MAPITRFLVSLLALAPALAAAFPTAEDAVVARTSYYPSHPKIQRRDSPSHIRSSYIVAYDEDASDDAIKKNQDHWASELAKRNVNKRSVDGKRSLSTKVETINLKGARFMLVDADDETASEIADSDVVSYVEADQKVSHHDVIQQTNGPVGLNRLSADDTGADVYTYDDSAGDGMTAYVVDTGILLSHVEFEGRAKWGANYVNDNDTDENGHGSHVSGTIGGATYGVAKKIELIAVKVLDADGQGSNAGVLRGMQFVVKDVKDKDIAGKAVMNMSLGGGPSSAINRAIQAIYEAGVVPCVAAGNNDINAKFSSPASAENAITVGAIDARTDVRASFSNWGPDVDIYASGVNVLSCGIDNDTASAVLSGTSMATPHITGLSAYLMAWQDISSVDDVTTLIKNLATQAGGDVLLNVEGTTDLIANNGYPMPS